MSKSIRRNLFICLFLIACILPSMISLQPTQASPTVQVMPSTATPMPPSVAKTVYPLDDTYTSSGSPQLTQGAATLLRLASSTVPQREIYLKFDIDVVPKGKTITRARLWMCGMNGTGVVQSVDVYAVSNTTWQEETLNYVTRPPMGAKLATASMGLGWDANSA